MIGAFLALALAAPAPQPTDFGRRLRESAIEAERLQGPLDGTWRLTGASGGPLLTLQISDPVDSGALAAAWRSMDAHPRLGPATRVTRVGGRLELALATEDGAAFMTVRLRRRGSGVWTGWLTEDGRVKPVTMTRRRGALDGER